MRQHPPLVAVLNNDPDLINMLATWLETHGIVLYDLSVPLRPELGHLDVSRRA